MDRLKRGLLCGALGVFIGFALVTFTFAGFALLDGTTAAEAFGFGLAVGIGGMLIGGMIGFAVGVLDLGPVGGALGGGVATFAAVAFYVVVFGDPGRLVHFLRESGIVVLVLGLPSVVTGVLTALVAKSVGRDMAKPSSDEPLPPQV